MTLPTWLKDAAGKWYCEDKDEWAFAQKCDWMVTQDAFFSFDVPAFDQWLSEQPEGELKTRLLAIRAKAKAARGVAARLAYLGNLRANLEAVPRLRTAERKGPRSARRPRLAAWLGEKLRHQPELTAKQLWQMLPDDSAGEQLYRIDAEHATELRDNDEPMRALTFGGFETQVTKAKKRRTNRA